MKNLHQFFFCLAFLPPFAESLEFPELFDPPDRPRDLLDPPDFCELDRPFDLSRRVRLRSLSFPRPLIGAVLPATPV